jgi:hypothetical protein
MSDTIRRIRAGAVLTGGAVVLLVTVAATFAQVASGEASAAAARLWPVAGAPRADAAALRLTRDQSPGALRAIRADATAVLLREPTNVVAARTAGLAAEVGGDLSAARALLTYSETLSRRDLGTQTALIELAVASGDIPLALRHYDTALRTSDAADQLLMPVLVDAAREPAVARVLQPMLAQRPPWRMRFVYSLLTSQPWRDATMMPLLTASRLDSNDPLERDFTVRALKGLLDNGRVADAIRLFERSAHTSLRNTVRNGDFSKENRLPPFDWEIVDEPALGAFSGAANEGSFPGALSLNADPGRSGIVARQLLRFDPGRYRLRFVAGSIPADSGDRSSIAISCGEAPLVTLRLPPAPDRPRRVEVQFAVPAGCPMQLLAIQAASDIDSPRAAAAPWISAISVTPIS